MRFSTTLFCLIIGLQANAKEGLCLKLAEDILDKIKCLNNVSQVTEKMSKGQLRQFEIQYSQPADHKNLQRGTFNQKLVLLHLSENEPMVLQTSGYMIYRVAQTAIARMFQTNQLQIEHRFFSNSTPNGGDWSLLNIEQSADDFHRITVDFKKLYPKNWVGTGASKGGMTSSYHRYFYPEDLDGTIVDVAPLSFSRTDQRYNTFLRQVGGESYSECRSELAHFQKHMLKHRENFLDRIKGSFDQLGGPSVAYEHAVIELPFYFWQYGNPESKQAGCKAIPDHHDDDAMYRFLNMHADIGDYVDANLQRFIPYFYQAATELGGPDTITDHLEPYRLFEFGLDLYTPKGVRVDTYSNYSMRAISNWVQTEATNMMFIYGSYDPWTAAEYDIGNNENVSKLYVPGGNHGANYTKLPSAERQWAIGEISRWLQKEPVIVFEKQNDITGGQEKTLNEIEFEMKKEFGIR